MKFCIFIACSFLTAIVFSSLLYAQEKLSDSRGEPVPDFLLKKISIDLEETPLPQALTEISKKGKFYLNFREGIIPTDKKVSIHLENIPTAIVLHRVLQDTDIGFIVSKGGQIVLVESEVVKANMKHTISGFIRDAETGESMIGTNVYTDKLKSGCTSNAYGFYSMTLPVGEYTIYYSYLGYETKKIEINLYHNLSQDIELKTSPILGDSVVVRVNMVIS